MNDVSIASYSKISVEKVGAYFAAEVKGIGVSGQQHGFVPMDKNGEVIRPAKLWCDITTVAQCEQITGKLGGLKRTIATIGNAMSPGFTAPKIAWLKIYASPFRLFANSKAKSHTSNQVVYPTMERL